MRAAVVSFLLAGCSFDPSCDNPLDPTHDFDGDQYTEDEGDCDDTEPAWNPDADEVCGDGIDQDCDGEDLACRISGELGTPDGRYDRPGDGLAFYPAGDLDGDGLDEVIATHVLDGVSVLGGETTSVQLGLEATVLGRAEGYNNYFGFVNAKPVRHGLTGAALTLGIGAHGDNAAYLLPTPFQGDQDLRDPPGPATRVVGPPAGGFGRALAGLGDGDGDAAAWIVTSETASTWVIDVPLAPGEHDVEDIARLELVRDPPDNPRELAKRIGDLDGDGRADAGVGTLRDDVCIAHAATLDGQSGTVTVDALLACLRPEGVDEAEFNVNFNGAGDVDGDGLDDLLIGAKYGVARGSGTQTGYALLIYGRSGGIPAGTQWDRSEVQLVTSQAAAELGWGIAGAGDQDGDGYAELAVGAPGYDDSAGRVWVLPGGPDLAGRIDLDDSDLPIATAAGEQLQRLGYHLGAVDLDGDGWEDLLIGEEGFDTWPISVWKGGPAE